nr:helix-turn-helix domain-containing protein [Escherichia coli]
MKTLAERLKIGREKAGMSQAQLAEKIGLSQQSVAKIENGETLQPRKIKEIAKVLGVSQKWLQLGIEDNASIPDLVVKEAESTALDPDIFVNIPVLDVELSAGNGCLAEIVESAIDWFPLRRADLRKSGVCASNAKIVKIWGNSLLPVLNNGDLVAVDISQTVPFILTNQYLL